MVDERQRLRDIVDLHEGRIPVPILDDRGIAEVLRTSRRIAVIGASDRPDRPSHGVFRRLVAHGYDCVPITPTVSAVAGVPAFATLEEAVAATGPFDIVDVFRRAESCAAHAREAVAVGARCLWLQLGIVSWEAARIAHAGGVSVVMDRCTAIELDRLEWSGSAIERPHAGRQAAKRTSEGTTSLHTASPHDQGEAS